MKSFAKLTICLIATLWVGLASAQTTSPNAYVYVISNPSTNTYELRGYKADATGALTIEDLNSANGTYVNRAKIYPGQPQALGVGSTIQIGTVHMRIKV